LCGFGQFEENSHLVRQDKSGAFSG